MKCKKCKQECQRVSSGIPGGWEYWYCKNWDCELGSPNNAPQHPNERNYNTLERNLEAHARKRQTVEQKEAQKRAEKVRRARALATPTPKEK